MHFQNIYVYYQRQQFKIRMCRQLRQIYDKKSPIFLTELGILIATVLVVQYPSTCYPSLHTFYVIAIIVSSSQIFLKSIGLAIIHTFNKELANTIQSILVGLYIISHVGLWVYSITLLMNQQFKQLCRFEQPHLFYVKVYAFVYGALILGSIMLLLGLLLPVTVLTLFSFKRKQQIEAY